MTDCLSAFCAYTSGCKRFLFFFGCIVFLLLQGAHAHHAIQQWYVVPAAVERNAEVSAVVQSNSSRNMLQVVLCAKHGSEGSGAYQGPPAPDALKAGAAQVQGRAKGLPPAKAKGIVHSTFYTSSIVMCHF